MTSSSPITHMSALSISHIVATSLPMESLQQFPSQFDPTQILLTALFGVTATLLAVAGLIINCLQLRKRRVIDVEALKPASLSRVSTEVEVSPSEACAQEEQLVSGPSKGAEV
ncbi:hypothetical protein Slin15195_G086900 [Septoria linicola]|uniref:Uncharacterized protein n=1 Tax=Septoria linicola TaxID=215465 RepID=A0A9Q9B145_9PEZI|nr:hypothetical protein Slin14017_G089490 [Septoria linicola]USW55371.1 hypothetical protein Slin15195_G086900 [Septoria linicola]